MNEIPVHNSGKEIIYIGGYAIPPGETRLCDVNQVPAHLRSDAAPVEAVKQVEKTAAELALDGKAKDIVTAIQGTGADGNFIISDQLLSEMLTAEGAQEKPRKGVVEALNQEIMKRAAARAAT